MGKACGEAGLGWGGRKTKSLDMLSLRYLLDVHVQFSCKQLDIPSSVCRERSWWRYKLGSFIEFLKPIDCFNSYRENTHVFLVKRRGGQRESPVTLQHLGANPERKGKQNRLSRNSH